MFRRFLQRSLVHKISGILHPPINVQNHYPEFLNPINVNDKMLLFILSEDVKYSEPNLPLLGGIPVITTFAVLVAIEVKPEALHSNMTLRFFS